MGGLTHQFGLRDAEAVSERVEPHDLSLGQRGLASGTVAVGPCHVVNLLAGGFDQIAEKALVVFWEVHVRTGLAGAAWNVKAALPAGLT